MRQIERRKRKGYKITISQIKIACIIIRNSKETSRRKLKSERRSESLKNRLDSIAKISN